MYRVSPEPYIQKGQVQSSETFNVSVDSMGCRYFTCKNAARKGCKARGFRYRRKTSPV